MKIAVDYEDDSDCHDDDCHLPGAMSRATFCPTPCQSLNMAADIVI